ncbi:MAG: RNA polymerase sigma factor [Candidatus Limnocylindrales bacterium]
MFRKVSGPEEDRLVAFDPDRPAVEAARRDPTRFETLYRRYVAQVYNFAVYQLADHHAAEDLTEQVFLQALAALPHFREQPRPDGASSFRAWLFQIARNLVRNERRFSRRHPAAPIEMAALEMTGADDPAVWAAQRDEAARAWAAVARLPDDRRTAVVLRFVDEMPVAEIAGVLGRSEGAVRVLLHRALRSVAAELRGPQDARRVSQPAGGAARGTGRVAQGPGRMRQGPEGSPQGSGGVP